MSEDERDPTPTSNHLFPEFAITDGVGLRGKHPGEGGTESAGEVLNPCWCARGLSPPRRAALSLEERERLLERTEEGNCWLLIANMSGSFVLNGLI